MYEPIKSSLCLATPINYRWPEVRLQASVYTSDEKDRMQERDFGQTWYAKFGPCHQCVGALMLQVTELSAARKYQYQYDAELAYAVTPYIDTNDGTVGGMSRWSYPMTGEALASCLSIINERLTAMTLKCKAARILFRQSIATYLNTEDFPGEGFVTLPTEEVIYYYVKNHKELF